MACHSKKAPVPAAQTEFILKSLIIESSKIINFESCPPISIIVLTFLIEFNVPNVCDIISLFTVNDPPKIDGCHT